MTFTKEEAYFAAVRADLKVFLQQASRTLYPGKAVHGQLAHRRHRPPP